MVGMPLAPIHRDGQNKKTGVYNVPHHASKTCQAIPLNLTRVPQRALSARTERVGMGTCIQRVSQLIKTTESENIRALIARIFFCRILQYPIAISCNAQAMKLPGSRARARKVLYNDRVT